MEPFIQKIDRVLKSRFEGAQTELEQDKTERRVSGFLIWKGFEGSDQIERQKQVWNVLREQLPQRDQGKVLAIFTLSPRELEVIRSEP